MAMTAEQRARARTIAVAAGVREGRADKFLQVFDGDVNETTTEDGLRSLVAATLKDLPAFGGDGRKYGPPLTRALIEGMPDDEYDRRADEINRWVAAGAKDGEGAPALERVPGHVFTRDEIATMPLDEFDANETAILAQVPQIAKQKATR